MNQGVMKMADTMTKTIADDLRAQVQSVLDILDSFGKLLTDETAALKNSDFQSVDRLQEGKRRLAREYQAVVEALAARKEEMPKLDIRLREQLVKRRTIFTAILDDNLRALEASKDSAARLVNKILEAARRAVTDKRQTNYSAKGKAQACKTSTLSLSVDQKL